MRRYSESPCESRELTARGRDRVPLPVPPFRFPAYLDGATRAARRRFESPTVQVAERRVDVARAAAECDLAVLNGGHVVTAEMLLAGKPVLAVPLVLGQQMTGDALRRLGAGESAPPRRGEP